MDLCTLDISGWIRCGKTSECVVEYVNYLTHMYTKHLINKYWQSAMWNPDGKVLLAAFDQTTSLAALHFAGKPPSLGKFLYLRFTSLELSSTVYQ